MKIVCTLLLALALTGCESKCEKLKDSSWGRTMSMTGGGRHAVDLTIRECKSGELSDSVVNCLLNANGLSDSASCY